MPPRPRRLRVVPALERCTCAGLAFGAPGVIFLPQSRLSLRARYISALTCTGISAVHHRYTARGIRSSPARKPRVTYPCCRVSPVRIVGNHRTCLSKLGVDVGGVDVLPWTWSGMAVGSPPG
jgi:hypothetical protein